MRHTCSAAVILILSALIVAPVAGAASDRLSTIGEKARGSSKKSSSSSSGSSFLGSLLGSLFQRDDDSDCSSSQSRRPSSDYSPKPYRHPSAHVEVDAHRPRPKRKSTRRNPSTPVKQVVAIKESNPFTVAAGQFFYHLLSAPFVVPQIVTGDQSGTEKNWSFLDYPYQNDLSGNMQPYDRNAPKSRLGSYSIQASLEHGIIDESLTYGRLRLRAATRSRIDFQADLTRFREELDTGKNDYLTLSDINAVYRFAQNEYMQWHVGAGVRYTHDGISTENGFNLVYGVDIYPIRPLVLSGEIEGGMVGEAGVFEARGTVGIMLDRTEFYAGYHYLNFDGLELHGPIGGLQVWF